MYLTSTIGHWASLPESKRDDAVIPDISLLVVLKISETWMVQMTGTMV
jgi:hypothetical protein